MKSYVIVDAQGEILRTLQLAGDFPSENLAGEGEVLVDGEKPPVPAYWNGQGWVAKPDKPHVAAVWDPVAKAWADPRTIEQLQDEKWEEIKTIRSQLEFLPFEWDGSWFDADLPRLMGAALRGKDTVWTLADNSLRFMTGPEIYAAAQALGDRTDQIFERSRMLRTVIYDTKDPQKIAEINWHSPLAELT